MRVWIGKGMVWSQIRGVGEEDEGVIAERGGKGDRRRERKAEVGGEWSWWRCSKSQKEASPSGEEESSKISKRGSHCSISTVLTAFTLISLPHGDIHV